MARFTARIAVSLASALVFSFAIAVASATAAPYPSRPIDFIVPWGPGGGADYVGRALSKEMSPILHVSLPVVNIPGGTGQTGLIKMGQAAADGYTIEEVTSETVLLPITEHPPFMLDEFIPLGIVDQQNPGLLVGPNSPFKNWTDIVTAAKTRSISVAFDGFGSIGGLLVNYLNRHLGTKFNLVPYAKPGERIASVLGGENELLFTQPGDVQTYIKGGQLRPVLMFADKPDLRFPDVPTSKSLGYATLVHFRAMYVRKGTPEDIIHLLAAALEKAERSSTYQAALEQEDALPTSLVSAANSEQFVHKWQTEAEAIKNSR
jgi:tripartite-type tricarboxylate transporter receptor subunit TctC